ncbi:MAG: TetR/AcrR family transcriptional regulator [Saprospiraceae bacterium]|nr:TetR/AcrR family transcriptional regulator [Saprospiraceae bacterium]
MGLAERKEREKNELRELILMKAREIIIREGQNKLSIRKIAAEIEYSPATIYLYFQDKDEILYQMMQKGFELMATSMEDIYHESSPTKRIFLIGKAYIRFGVENQDWYELMFNAVSPMNHIERCKSEWGPGIAIFEYLVSTCSEAISENKLTTLDARILALQLWSTVHGLVCLANTLRLTIVDANCEQGKECDLLDKTLENSMLSLFNYIV